jgi:subtilisin family serine protease
MATPRKIDHPSFGSCELVPTIVAISWKTPVSPETVRSNLSEQALTVSTETLPKPREKANGKGRDPRLGEVNNSATLTFVSGETASTDAALAKLRDNENIEWIAPVYRAAKADEGPVSFFAINPTVLLIAVDALAAVDDLVDKSARINEQRSKLLKGYVVLDLPKANAIEVAETIRSKGGAAAAAGIKFENIPYLSPTTACSSCAAANGNGHHTTGKNGKCAPAVTDLIPNDTFFPQQWGLHRINAPRSWPITEGDPNIVIAVLDEGVELGHPDLNLWPISYSTITHQFDGSPVNNHGTACAGIISSQIENATGAAGLAGKCKVMAISTNWADTQIAEGLYFAADNGARIVSMSFGVYPSWMIWDFGLIEAALEYCQQKNVLLVAATGNENQNVSRFPATDPRTLGVGGSNRADVRKQVGDSSIEPFWGACFGPDVDVVAPCLEIPTTDRLGGNGYTPNDYDLFFNGTSAATPHVAALAGLILSVNPNLTNVEVRQIISETTDKINQPAYVYLPTAGKPFGAWNNDVGYGRINAERALLVACAPTGGCKGEGPCGVDIPLPDVCCVSPCDPPWRPDEQCFYWYETKFFRVPLTQDLSLRSSVDDAKLAERNSATAVAFLDRNLLSATNFIEFRITYEHKLCLLGKQHGPLLYTQTLLPGEKVTLYHSDRYRRVTSETNRFSVQTTFAQYLSAIHQARVTNSLEILADRLGTEKGSSSVSVGGGLFGFLGGPSGGASAQFSVTDHNMLHVGVVSESFNQSVFQASQMTHSERSVVVSTFEEKEIANVTARTIQNDNECRAVTYFIRKVVELYAVSTRVSDISYRIVAGNAPPEWHSTDDIEFLPPQVQRQFRSTLNRLPKVGQVVERPRPISLPTDGTVYDPELAHCCSCEPERAAAIAIRLEKQKAQALKECLEAQQLQLEVERRKLLLQRGELGSFDASPALLPAHPALLPAAKAALPAAVSERLLSE